MDRLGDSELCSNTISSNSNASMNTPSQRSSGFLSSLLTQNKKPPPSKSSPASVSSPTQTGGSVPLKKETAISQVGPVV
ncbi:hypothetical protein XELAEV_18016722mg [Xenopus laevis]|uniref:Uncharacterized protein n=1 Tax=Xenopus laevis TaxID=8355 RepID=A0A974DC00_XENLA|nr:hypothetical protein XELAEV_18016722mg [Xenopus laevis]